MIKKCKCVGLARGKSKEGKPFTTLYFDVTHIVEDGDRNVGQFVSSVWQSGHFKNECIGQEFLCSVDIFGRVKDIET